MASLACTQAWKPAIRSLQKRTRFASWKSKQHMPALRSNIQNFAEFFAHKKSAQPGIHARPLHALALPGQAFDDFYLRASNMYLTSRKKYLHFGGEFESRLCTSPRSLSSSILLENRIQYSPTEDELLWRATDRVAKKELNELSRLIGYSTSLFHEQSHRILWFLLPRPSDLSNESLRRYLNFVESLVVAIDMALGDQLGPELSALGYQSGVLYDPGTYAEFTNKRVKRNYYHAAIRATYLLLEGYHRDDIPALVHQAHPELEDHIREHAINRALRLDDLFVELTNPEWQKKNLPRVRDAFKRAGVKFGKKKTFLDVSEDPKRWEAPYLAIEKVFDEFRV